MSDHAQRFGEFAQLNLEWSLGDHNSPQEFADLARWREQQRALGVGVAAALERGENDDDPHAAMAAVRTRAEAAHSIAQQRTAREQRRAVEHDERWFGLATPDPSHRPQGVRQRTADRQRRQSTREGVER